MEYIVERDDSRSYLLVQHSKIMESEDYLFGCDFEFYPNEKYNQEQFIKELCSVLKTDVVVKDVRSYMELKAENPLEFTKLKISTSICSYANLGNYISLVNELIEQYGYTNDDTILHIHIFRRNTSLNFDFYQFVLLGEERGLFDDCDTENGYRIDIWGVMNYNAERDDKVLKNKKGQAWNFKLASTGHVQIRTIDGIGYHLKSKDIIEEIIQCHSAFRDNLLKDSESFKTMKKRHLQMLKNILDEINIGFVKLFFK